MRLLFALAFLAFPLTAHADWYIVSGRFDDCPPIEIINTIMRGAHVHEPVDLLQVYADRGGWAKFDQHFDEGLPEYAVGHVVVVQGQFPNRQITDYVFADSPEMCERAHGRPAKAQEPWQFYRRHPVEPMRPSTWHTGPMDANGVRHPLPPDSTTR